MENSKKEFERLKEEEKSVYFDSFSREDAYRLGILIIENAQKKQLPPLGVEIVLNGLIIFRFYADDITRDNELWLLRKRNSVEFMEMSSLRMKALAEMENRTLADWLINPSTYALAPGGYPINLNNTGLIGSVCVTGLPGIEDHQIIVDAMKEYIGSVHK